MYITREENLYANELGRIGRISYAGKAEMLWNELRGIDTKPWKYYSPMK